MSTEVHSLRERMGLFIGETRGLFKLALPMVVGQVSQYVLPIVTTILMGKVGVVPLAGVSFGNAVMMFFLIIAMGLCVPVHVYVSQARGANETEEAGSVLKHGIWLTLFYSVPVALFFTLFIDVLDGFGQPAEVLPYAKWYVVFTIWSIVPELIFRCLRNFSEAWNHPWEPFWGTVFYVVLNVFLAWALILGKCGLPAMGAEGAGISILVSRVVGLVVYYWVFVRNARKAELRWSMKGFFKIDRVHLKKMFLVGFPTMVQIGFEFGFFSAAMIMMGWLGAMELAAQQVATNYVSCMFMIPLGLAFATTIRVGEAVGEKNLGLVKLVGWTGVAWGAMVMMGIGVMTFTMREWIAGFFVQDVELIGMASGFLMIAAFMQMWDGTQVCMMAALRGLPDVKVPLAIVLSSYWLVGVPLCYVLGFKMGLGGKGIWLGILIGLVVGAVSLIFRFKRMVKVKLRF